MKFALTALILAAPLALAQSPASAPAPSLAAASAANTPPLIFDAVSIKPNHSGAPSMLDRTTRDGYSVENYPVRLIVSNAFDVRYDLISGGPGWLDSDHYDIVAKVAGADLPAYRALSKSQRNQMVQAILADRFHFVAHTETKELSGFTLAVARDGSKLHAAKPGEHTSYGANYGDYNCTAVTVATLAKLLSQQLQQTVLDQTGLTDKYTFDLKWDWQGPGAHTPAAGEASEPSSLPALPTALQEELGLKLTPAKLPTTTLVIDSIARPSEN